MHFVQKFFIFADDELSSRLTTTPVVPCLPLCIHLVAHLHSQVAHKNALQEQKAFKILLKVVLGFVSNVTPLSSKKQVKKLAQYTQSFIIIIQLVFEGEATYMYMYVHVQIPACIYLPLPPTTFKKQFEASAWCSLFLLKSMAHVSVSRQQSRSCQKQIRDEHAG